MKKIRISENELISLIEKAVNENLGTTPSLTAHGGGFSNLGMGKPTDKYKDLYEDDDIEEEMVEDQDPGTEKSSAVAIDQEKDVENDWTGGSGRNPSMNIESIVERLKRKLEEQTLYTQTIPDITPDVKIPEGLFTKKASEIVAGLKALKNGAKEALTRITYYINRAGKNLSNKTEVLKAKEILKKEKEDK